MKKYIIIVLSVLLLWQNAFCQDKSGSVLKSKGYYENPIKYLSKINEDLMSTDVLIDRTFYSDLILKCNGKDKVSVIQPSDWSNLRSYILFSSSNKRNLKGKIEIRKIVDNYYKKFNVFPIGVLDYTFDRLDPEAFASNKLEEKDEFLEVNTKTSDIFVQNRVVASSVMAGNVTGDQIRFIISSDLFFTNQDEKEIESIEVDFANGQGFQKVIMDKAIMVKYRTPKSGYIQIVVKINYLSKDDSLDVVYSHSILHRTGSEAVPTLEPLSSNKRYEAPSVRFGYPDGCETYHPEEIVYDLNGWDILYITPEYWTYENCDLDIAILYATDDYGKLRRPFVVTDGFDYENKRDYARNDIEEDLDLPKNNDFRGLYQFVNGDPSPWENTEPSANFLGKLQDDGYDLVFINFIDGAGDIPTNASKMRAFFNEKLNGAEYRDNKTEEMILVGPSMGGLITRHMITTMESANPPEEHFIKTWVAFDSPMKGASIPLSLQHTVDFLSDIHTVGNNQLEALEASAIHSVEKLRSPAAQQLLVAHFDYTRPSSNEEHPDPTHTFLYRDFDEGPNSLGYPEFSKRYSISCGGEEKLYEIDENASNWYWAPTGWLNFPVYLYDNNAPWNNLRITPKFLGVGIIPWLKGHGYSHHNDFWTTKHKIFKGSKQGANSDVNIKTKQHIGIDNGPGGYITALYEINANPDNWYEKDAIPENDQWMKSTFMPTVSVLGITPTKDNIYDIWRDYEPSDTPFDNFMGVDGRNQEHVNISIATSENIIQDWLHPDFNIAERPFNRPGQTHHQTVSKPVAYTYKDKIFFGRHGNTFTLENGADVHVTTTNLIKFDTGFSIKQGAKLKAWTEPVDYGTVFRKENQPRTVAVDPNIISTDRFKVYDYSNRKIIGNKLISEAQNNVHNSIVLYPNPVSNILNVEILEIGSYDIWIYNALGQLQNKIKTHGKNVCKIDISDLVNGVYYMKIQREGKEFQNAEFIKY